MRLSRSLTEGERVTGNTRAARTTGAEDEQPTRAVHCRSREPGEQQNAPTVEAGERRGMTHGGRRDAAKQAAEAAAYHRGHRRANGRGRGQHTPISRWLELLVSPLQHEPVPEPRNPRAADRGLRGADPRNLRDIHGMDQPRPHPVQAARYTVVHPRQQQRGPASPAQRKPNGIHAYESGGRHPRIRRTNRDGARRPLGLAEPFGRADEPAIQVDAGDMPAGPLIRIEINGNHRVAALAALADPCVLAEVRLHTWPVRHIASGRP